VNSCFLMFSNVLFLEKCTSKKFVAEGTTGRFISSVNFLMTLYSAWRIKALVAYRACIIAALVAFFFWPKKKQKNRIRRILCGAEAALYCAIQFSDSFLLKSQWLVLEPLTKLISFHLVEIIKTKHSNVY
jgi:hypothetical protein